ncbi:MAG: hypothetical protein LBG06_00035 [Deltaproteobacteria bacterium]|jgi:hypothetical protein|nr:hypothetical protein [Deltaproteobacteria bacterium]
MRGAAASWRRALARCPAAAGLILAWTASLGMAIRPGWALAAAPPLALSAGLLSLLAPRKIAMFRAAVVFLGFWSLAALALRGPGAEGGFRPEVLAGCLFLGLHLFFVWTPAGLGRGVRILARPFCGARRAALLGLTLTALAKVIPAVLADARASRRSLSRLAGAGLGRRAAFRGRILTRLTLKRTRGLGRTLAKRQRDLG